MAAVIALLRGVNVGGHHAIRMDALRALCESLGCAGPRTYVQSGNVVFKTGERDLDALARRIEEAVGRTFGFQPNVILRTAAEMKGVIARNPFASRTGLDPARLLVTFLARDPGAEASKKLLAIPTEPEELRVDGREVYTYYPNGIGRSKLSPALIEKVLQTPGTGRNWNSVTRLLEMAESIGPLKRV